MIGAKDPDPFDLRQIGADAYLPLSILLQRPSKGLDHSIYSIAVDATSGIGPAHHHGARHLDAANLIKTIPAI
jgi:hypothetical protein